MADTFIIISVILQILTIGVLIGFVLVLIKLIKALTQKIESVSDDVIDLKVKVEPLIEHTAKFIGTANKVAETIENNMDKLSNTVDTIKETVTKVTDLVDNVREKIEPPVMETVASYNGLVKGIKVFFEAIKHRVQKTENRVTETDFEIDFDDKYIKMQKKSEPVNSSEYSELDNINAELNELRRKIQEQD